jgi:XTP/dITP diphosphohydrolase
MKELVFATNNPNKLKEVQSMLGNEFKLLTLKEIGCDTDIPEDQDTLEGNAKQKAQFLFEK